MLVNSVKQHLNRCHYRCGVRTGWKLLKCGMNTALYVIGQGPWYRSLPIYEVRKAIAFGRYGFGNHVKKMKINLKMDQVI